MSEPQKQKSKIKTLFTGIGILFALILILIAMMFIFTYCGNNPKPSLLKRNATNNDIHFNTDFNFSLSVGCTIKPYSDITDLQLTFNFFDKNKNLIATKIKVVGNVQKDIEYNINFSLTEFSLTELLAMQSYQIHVTSGTISYFQ